MDDTEEPYDLVQVFKTDPMLAREFLEIDEEISKPWVRVRFLLYHWWEMAWRWTRRSAP